MKKAWCIPLVCLYFVSCSSAPKVAPGVYIARNEAAGLVKLGAKYLREGHRGAALDLYTEAYRVYTMTDDPEGRIVSLDGLGRLSKDPTEYYTRADRIAAESGRKDLIALSSLLLAEHSLAGGAGTDLGSVRRSAEEAASALGGRPADKARALRIQGSAAKAMGDHKDALSRFDEAAALDKKANLFIEYASDRYLAASVHSKTGDYKAAAAALLDALDYDRKAENPEGIGGDYQALGLVAQKAGQTAEAEIYFTRASEVYEAARLSAQAVELKRLSGLGTP